MAFRFPIRGKVLIGLAIPSLCLAALIFHSHANLGLIEQRLQVLARINDAERSIMELRRQGKLFLFYGERREYDAVFEESSRAIDILAGTRDELLYAETRDMLGKLIASLENYRESIRAVREPDAPGRTEILRLKSQAHMASMDIEEQIMSLAAEVRETIGRISAALRAQLFVAALGAAGLFLLVAYYISAYVLRPLKELERTAGQIGAGNFSPVPLAGVQDEIRDLQQAFNLMVSELKDRQEQLVQSQKLSSIGTLSAGIAHQLNNPLNNIALSLQMARHYLSGPLELPLARALDNIEKEGERARDIVLGLLDFSRQSPFCLQRASLADVADTAVRLASAQLKPGVRLEKDLPDDLMLNLDPRRMSEALLNIIMNGIQAVGEGPGLVRLFLTSAPPGMVTLAVEDDGQGIAPEDLPHIFDPFFTRKDVGQGTGLGLAVGYGIIKECGGRVRVESAVGQGTRFFIDLPLPETKTGTGTE